MLPGLAAGGVALQRDCGIGGALGGTLGKAAISGARGPLDGMTGGDMPSMGAGRELASWGVDAAGAPNDGGGRTIGAAGIGGGGVSARGGSAGRGISLGMPNDGEDIIGGGAEGAGRGGTADGGGAGVAESRWKS